MQKLNLILKSSRGTFKYSFFHFFYRLWKQTAKVIIKMLSEIARTFYKSALVQVKNSPVIIKMRSEIARTFYKRALVQEKTVRFFGWHFQLNQAVFIGIELR